MLEIRDIYRHHFSDEISLVSSKSIHFLLLYYYVVKKLIH